MPVKSLILFALAIFTPALAQLRAADAQVLDGVAAVVNDEVITFTQVRELTMPVENAAKTSLSGAVLADKIKEVRLRAVNDLVDRQLIIQEFRKMKGATIPSHVVDDRLTTIIREEFGGDRSAFLRTIAAQGFTIEKLRKMEEEKIIVGAMRAREVKTEPVVTAGQVERYYNEHRQEWTSNDAVKLRLIKIVPGAAPEKKRKLIQEIRDKIVGGADFGDMARIYSEDSTQDANGDWGWVKRGDMSGELERVIFAQKTGKVSEIVSLNATYYLLLVEARKAGDVKPLKAMRGDIEKHLMQVERQKLQQVWTDRLRKKAFVKIY